MRMEGIDLHKKECAEEDWNARANELSYSDAKESTRAASGRSGKVLELKVKN